LDEIDYRSEHVVGQLLQLSVERRAADVLV
jgi:hypothetical protein